MEVVSGICYIMLYLYRNRLRQYAS